LFKSRQKPRHALNVSGDVQPVDGRVASFVHHTEQTE